MKALLGSLTLVLALGFATANVMSADAKETKKKEYVEGSCCDKAVKKGETCAHKCCVAAEKEGKVCAKCNKPKKEEK